MTDYLVLFGKFVQLSSF